MKLGSYQAALYTFERALAINPLLSSSSAGINMRACRAALQSQQSQGYVAISAGEQSTSSATSSQGQQQRQEHHQQQLHGNYSMQQPPINTGPTDITSSHQVAISPIINFVDYENQ